MHRVLLFHDLSDPFALCEHLPTDFPLFMGPVVLSCESKCGLAGMPVFRNHRCAHLFMVRSVMVGNLDEISAQEACSAFAAY